MFISTSRVSSNKHFIENLFTIDVDNIKEIMVDLKEKEVNIAMDITPISVGLMSRIIDPNGINIVFIEHNK